MRRMCTQWLLLATTALALTSCSKSTESTSSRPSGAGGGGGGFDSYQSTITDSAADVAEAPSEPAAPEAPAPPPPPAPTAPMAMPSRVTTETRETSVGGVVNTRTTKTTSEPVAMPMNVPPPIFEPPMPPVQKRRQPDAQSGLLTAGDYDDLLNPRAYANYASGFLQGSGADLPFVDTRSRISVKVMGSDGRPVPFAKVSIRRRPGPLVLTTAADGVVSFYPAFDKVSGRTSVAVTSSAGAATGVIDVAKGPQNVALKVAGRAAQVSQLDIALVVDTTGSMGDEMEYLHAEIDSIVRRVRRNAGNVDIRIGLIAYKDDGDEYVVKSYGMGRNPTFVSNTLETLGAGGGGDMPEAVDQAMKAAEQLQWRPNAVKAMLLVADAPPHDEKMAETLSSTGRLRGRGVQIVPVAASGVDDKAEYVMRTMAAMTQGRYIFLTDDSGVGDPHVVPQVSCYLVTHLDGLIARVVAGMVTGRRVEPRQSDVIREVGDYRNGRCSTENVRNSNQN